MTEKTRNNLPLKETHPSGNLGAPHHTVWPLCRIGDFRLEGCGPLGEFLREEIPDDVGVPIGAGLTDCQGLVHVPGAEWDAHELLKACRLSVWHFGSPRQVWRPLCLRTAFYLTRFQCLIMDFLVLFRRHIAAV